MSVFVFRFYYSYFSLVNFSLTRSIKFMQGSNPACSEFAQNPDTYLPAAVISSVSSQVAKSGLDEAPGICVV